MEEKKEKSKEEKQIKKKISMKRIRLPRILRLTIIGVIAIILLYSITTTYATFNKPEKTTKTYETLYYNQNGNFNYRVYLKNNTVYGGKEYLNPGEGKYFKKIIDHINGSFTYNFYISKTATIYGTYSLSAEIQTNYWTKKYILLPDKYINSNGTSYNFTEEFPIDYQYYSNVVDKINQEIGITISNPSVILKFNIILNINVEGKTIIKYFTPSMNFTIGTNTIDFSESLSNTQTGGNTEKQEIFHQEVINERNEWTTITFMLIIIIVVSIIITKSEKNKPSMEKTIKKIMKKYGEWIVEVEKPAANSTTSEVVSCKTIDDLMKISEELGKPVIHTEQELNSHTFYVIDNSTRYQYVLSNEKT